jgi:hypothetical protein
VGSVIRLLSGLTPGASREVQSALLDIAISEDEVSGGGFTEIPDLEEQLQLDGTPDRDLTDIQPTLENTEIRSLGRTIEGLTSAEDLREVFRQYSTMEGPQGNLRRKITDIRPVFENSEIRSSYLQPAFRRQSPSPSIHVPASRGGENMSHCPPYPHHSLGSVVGVGEDNSPPNSPPCYPRHPDPSHAAPGPTLMPSHFASDTGHYPRAGSSMGYADVSQRRGRVSLENVTHRDTKRPSERPRDREYHRRFSVGVPHANGSPPVPLGGHTWPRDDPFSPPTRSVVAVEMGLPVGQSGGQTRNQGNGRQLHDGSGAEEPYHIRLICAGVTVQHRVWLSMPIFTLIEEAGDIFGLDPAGISLVLFSASPVTLRR